MVPQGVVPDAQLEQPPFTQIWPEGQQVLPQGVVPDAHPEQAPFTQV